MINSAHLRVPTGSCCRFGLHDGEHVGAFCRTEGSAAHATAEGERHPLRHLQLLHWRPRQQPPRSPQRVRQGEQQSHGHARLECIRAGDPLLGTDRAGRQHILAQLLPGDPLLHHDSSPGTVTHCPQTEAKQSTIWIEQDIFIIQRGPNSRTIAHSKFPTSLIPRPTTVW